MSEFDIKEHAMRGGILTKLKAKLDDNRLGDMLLHSGKISDSELQGALSEQKRQGRGRLGQILVEKGLVSASTLRSKLVQQAVLKSMAAFVTVMIAFSSPAKARTGQKTTSQYFQLASISSMAPGHMKNIKAYPKLFASKERRSVNMKAFTKWSSMFKRFEAAVQSADSQPVLQRWRASLEPMRNMSLEEQARRVNSYINQTVYVTDDRNWRQSDYWATPVEFFKRGGDCEDFAIAKYASLRALGVPDSRLRIAIVHDKAQNIPHAVLIVYTDRGEMVLDNQSSSITRSANLTHRYKPIFSINQSNWWLHTAGA